MPLIERKGENEILNVRRKKEGRKRREEGREGGDEARKAVLWLSLIPLPKTKCPLWGDKNNSFSTTG